jgi:diguanylate cyclase (GGDEF)-like protein/PAS domain S-box-containing protein
MTELQDPHIFRTVLESLHTGVCLVGRDGKVLFWNEGAERITGYRRHDVIGRTCRESILAQCNQQHCVLCGVTCPQVGTGHDVINSGPALMFFRHKAGHRVPVHIRSAAVRGETGQFVGIAESFDEQSSFSEQESREHNLAAYGCLDAVTGVMNHALLRSYLREHLAFFTEYDLPFGILSIQITDLERFRTNYGREAADDVLHVVAETMKHCLGTAGFLGRWTEDEFLVIVPNCSAAELDHTGNNIESSVNLSEIKWWGDSLSVTISLGRTMVRADDTQEFMLKRARPLPRAPVAKDARTATASST